MPVLNIGGRRVTVDESFTKLSAEEQNETVDEIAASLGIAGDAEPEEGSGVALNATAGLNGAIYSAAGAPVDVMRGAMNLGIRGFNAATGSDVGMIPSDSFGGSEWIADTMGAAHPVLDPENTKAVTAEERIARGVGEGIGYAVAPEAAVGAMVRGGQLAGRAAETAGRVFGRGDDLAAATANAVVGGVSGAGAQAAMEAAPDEWDAVAGMAGGLAAGGAAAAATAVPSAVRAAGRFADDATAPMREAGRERLAADRLREAATDPDAAHASLEAGADEIVPGSMPTTGQATGDMGLLGLERAMQTKNGEPFAQRRADQNAARVGALEGVQPGGAPEAVSNAIRARLAMIDEETQAALDVARGEADAMRRGVDADTQASVDAARTRAEALRSGVDTDTQAAVETARGQADTMRRDVDEQTGAALSDATRAAQDQAGALGAGATPDVAGDRMRRALESARTRAKMQERALWAAVDPDGTLVLGTQGVREQAQAIRKGMPASAKPPSGEEAAILEAVESYRGTVPFSEMTALQSRLKAEMRAERFANGESPAYARLVRLNGAIERDFGAAVEGQVRREAEAVAAGTLDPANTVAARLEGVPSAGNAVYTPGGRSYPVEYEVVDASSLVSSNRPDGRANPDYPAELQPRDRTRAASDAQISGMSRNLQPERLGPSSEAGTGAPIVGADGVVESGNGRIAAIRRAYAENGPSAKAYRDYLTGQGYALDGIAEPVLIRRRGGDMTMPDRARFAQEANASSTLALSASEQAATDATRLTPEVLRLYRGGDVGSAENRDFARAFLGSVADRGQEGAFVTGSGGLSLDGAQRMRSAMMQAAYEDSRLVASLVDEGDENIRAFGRALDDLSGDVARLKSGVTSGDIDAGADLAPPLVEAARVVQGARASGVRLADAVAQQDAFSPISPAAMQVLEIAYGPQLAGRLSRERLTGIMRDVIAEAEQQTAGARLFGEPLDIATILGGARQRYGTATGSVPASGADRTLGATVRPADGGPGRLPDRPEQLGAGAGDARGGSPNILPDPEPNFDGAARGRLNEARASTRERVATFDNDTLRPIRRGATAGDPQMLPSAVPGTIFKSGAKGFDSVEAYRRAVGDDPEAMAAIRDYAIDRLQVVAGRADGTFDPAKARTWRNVHRDALRSFPELDAQIQRAADASGAATDAGRMRTEALRGTEREATTTLRDAERARTSALRDADRQGVAAVREADQARVVAMREAGRATEGEVAAEGARRAALSEFDAGRVGKLKAEYDPTEVSKLVGGAFKAEASAQEMLRIKSAVGKDEAGREGLKRAVVDHMVRDYLSTAEAGTSGVNAMKSDGYQQFVRKNKAALRTAGFDDAQIEMFERIGTDLQQANRSLVAVKAPGDSNTADKLLKVQDVDKPGSILAKTVLGVIAGGGAGASFGGPAGAAVGAAVAPLIAEMRRRGLKTVDDIVTDALLNPERARLLLSKATAKGERDTVARLVKLYRNGAVASGAVALGGEPDDATTPEMEAVAPPTVIPAPADRERVDSPRLTPDDRASPIPSDLIDDGKAVMDGERALPIPAPAERRRPDETQEKWSRFPSQSGTLKVPRAEMPQVKSEHRGALVNFLAARGIKHTDTTVPAGALKATQAEFSPDRVESAKARTGGDRAILVSSDWQVVDGHHQWLAKKEADEDVRVIRLDAPIAELLDVVREFPSAETEAAAKPKSNMAELKERAKERRAARAAA